MRNGSDVKTDVYFHPNVRDQVSMQSMLTSPPLKVGKASLLTGLIPLHLSDQFGVIHYVIKKWWSISVKIQSTDKTTVILPLCQHNRKREVRTQLQFYTTK